MDGSNVVFGIGQAYTDTLRDADDDMLPVMDDRSTIFWLTPILMLFAVCCCCNRLLKNDTHVVSYGPLTAVTVYQMLILSWASLALTVSMSICVLFSPCIGRLTVISCPGAKPVDNVVNTRTVPCRPYRVRY